MSAQKCIIALYKKERNVRLIFKKIVRGKIGKMLKKFLMICLLMITIVISVRTNVSAHEITKKISIKMQDLNIKGGPSLHVYYKPLRSDSTPEHYYTQAINAIAAWDNFAVVTDDGCNQLNPINANIFFSVNQSFWNSLGVSSTTLAVSWIVDTNGTDLYYISNQSETTGIIDYTVIYMHPTGAAFRDNTTNETIIKNRILKTMVHEIGHAIGLGHCDEDYYSPLPDFIYSIMRQGFPDEKNTGLAPQNHELDDVNKKY